MLGSTTCLLVPRLSQASLGASACTMLGTSVAYSLKASGKQAKRSDLGLARLFLPCPKHCLGQALVPRLSQTSLGASACTTLLPSVAYSLRTGDKQADRLDLGLARQLLACPKHRLGQASHKGNRLQLSALDKRVKFSGVVSKSLSEGSSPASSQRSRQQLVVASVKGYRRSLD